MSSETSASTPERPPEERVETVLASIEAGVRQRRAVTAAAAADGSAPSAEASELLRAARIEEPRAVSARPFFGPLLVFVRKAVYHLFLKWSLRPVLHQQNEFNQMAGLGVGNLAGSQRALRRELAALADRVEKLERRHEAERNGS